MEPDPEALIEQLDELVARLLKEIDRLERRLPYQKALLTYVDVAFILGVSDRKVKDLAASGELPIIKVGRNARVHPDVLKAYQRKHARQ